MPPVDSSSRSESLLKTIGTVPYIQSVRHSPLQVPSRLYTTVYHSPGGLTVFFHTEDPRVHHNDNDDDDSDYQRFMREKYTMSCRVDISYTSNPYGIPLVTKCEGRFGTGSPIYSAVDCKDPVFVPTEQDIADIRQAAQLQDIQSKYTLQAVVWNRGPLSATALIVNDQPCVRIRCGSDQLTFDVPFHSPEEGETDQGSEHRSMFFVKTALVLTP
jgi:hypothetical protein